MFVVLVAVTFFELCCFNFVVINKDVGETPKEQLIQCKYRLSTLCWWFGWSLEADAFGSSRFSSNDKREQR
jgi:hypothetical protein